MPRASNLVAIIPARSGSKGVKNKNLSLLGGYPLIAYSIAVAKMCEWERIIVSTDSEEYAEVARTFGAETPFFRPVELSDDSADDFGFMEHAMRWIDKNEKHLPEYWVHLRPTTPLRDPKLLFLALEAFKLNKKATSLRSVHAAVESPFKWFEKDNTGFLIPLFNSVTVEGTNYPRQQYPDAYIPNGYIDIVTPTQVLERSLLHGENILSFQSPYCVEVDHQDDLDYLNYKISKDGSVLLEYLRKKYPSSNHSV